MATTSQRTKTRDGALSSLNEAIQDLSLVKGTRSKTPARAVFNSVGVLLTTIRDSVANERDCVELGLHCANICRALDRGMDGKRPDDLSQSVRETINQLTATVAEIQRKVVDQGKRNLFSRLFHTRDDQGKITTWGLELDRILRVFNAELAINTHVTVSGIRDDVSKIREEVGGKFRSTHASMLGESPPPAPRACFGRAELTEKIVNLSENLTPVALIGVCGIGKTSIALTVPHHDHIKARFGDQRRFIRCDKFPASRANFLARISKAVGAGVDNLEDLTPLRPYLSSREMFIVLDNAESILDPRGVDGREIYSLVEELSQCSNICLCITSRITTVPPACKCLEVPTLSMDAARSTFRRIYDRGEPLDLVDNILKQLDSHPLSVTLLATVARQNKWGTHRLAREWEQRQTAVLQTEHNNSLADTIELSLSSPTFRELGHDARALLEIVAFFPQGIDEKNLDWLFPSIPDRATIFDKFCILSLTYRNNGFITMLAPLRDYLRPKDLKASPLLHAVRKRYFSRLSVAVDPDVPGFEDSRWIMSEDSNVEHLLDVITSTYPVSKSVWDVCVHFMRHLAWHKPRQTVLRSKIERLPNGHRAKRECLSELSRLSGLVGNHAEQRRSLTLVLALEREQGDVSPRVARALLCLSEANRLLGLYGEGRQQVKEALEIYGRFGRTVEQAQCLNALAHLLCKEKQLNAAEEAVSLALNFFPEKSRGFEVCRSYHILGDISRHKGEREKAICHYERALWIASSFKWYSSLFWIHYSLALLLSQEGGFDRAHAYVEQAKSNVAENVYYLGRATLLQASILDQQCRFEEARSEALSALEIFQRLGAEGGLQACRYLLQNIKGKTEQRSTTGKSDSSARGTPSKTLNDAPQGIGHIS